MSVQRLLGRAARLLADSRGRNWPVLLCSTFVVLLLEHAASAQTTFTVSNDAQLRSAVQALRDGDRIVLTNDITLASDLDPIQYDSVTIEGGGFTLSGGGRFRALTFDPGGYRLTAYVNNLTIRDAATFDAGKDLPTGFDGRGGGLLIANGASVYVSGVSLVSNIATGSVPSSPADTGGALFVQGGDSRFGVPAGQLIVTGSLTINGSTVGGGAAGAGLVMEGSGTVLFRPSSGQTMTIDDAIADVDSPRGLPGSGAWGLDLEGPGRLVLRGNNRYSGGTSVNGDGSVINVQSAANLGTGNVTVEHGGTLEIAGSSSFNNALLLDEIGRVSVRAGQTATWNGHVTNEHSDLQSGMLVVGGGGTLVLSDATNNYGSGTAVVDNSTLSVRADGALGAAGSAISLGNSQTRGTLGITGSMTTARPVTLGAAGGGIDVSNGVDAALTGAVGGPGGLTKSGAGSLALSAANTYAGPTTITAGTLRAGAANAFGTSGTMSIGRGATLELNNFDYTFNTLSGDGDVALGTAKLTTGSAGNSTLNGAISGAGALVKEGSGTFTLGGANSYSGGTFVHGGTLAGTTSSLQGAIANDATVAFRQDTDGTYAGTMTGTGALVKSGSGTVLLTGANTYSGGTTVSGGNLAGNTSSLQGDIVDNARVTFDQAQDGTFAGAIGGSGGVTKTGGGALRLTGANSYAGGTVVNAGSLVGDTRSVQGSIVNDATVVFEQGGDGTYGGAMSGSGRLIKNGAGALTLGGVNTYSGGTTVAAGTLIGNTAAIHGDVVNQGNVVFDQGGDGTYAGIVTGTGRLTKAGIGRVSLTGNNTYTGGTFVSGGTLEGNTSSLQGAIANDATVAFRQDTDGTYAGTITGTGALVKSGAGTLLLTGAHRYSGGTTVSGGNLAGNTSSLQGDIVDNARVTFDQAQDGTFAGAIGGSGGVTKTGGGALRLTGANSYGGGTVVNAGSLVGDTRSVQGSIVNDATVVFEQGGDGTYGGAMSGSGRLIKNGAGALRLGGVNSYSGGTTVNTGTLIGSTAAIRGDIVNQGNVVFDENGDGTYAGIMSGAGRLTKVGLGRVSLTGISSYTGGTFVNAGTLVGDTSTLRGSIFVNGGQLEFDQREDGILQGSLAGLGSIAKSGLGRLTVNQAGSLSGLLTVLQGGVTLNGPMAGSASIRSGADFTLNGSLSGGVTVDPGGVFNSLGSVGSLTVGGSWTVPIAVAASQPALSRTSARAAAQALDVPARFTVNGDLTTLPGSRVALEASGTLPPVQVNGAASFTGTQFNITVDDASRTRLKSYPLVSANAVTLANSTVTTQTPTLSPVLFADATTLRVSVLNLLIPISEVPRTGNGREVAEVLDDLKPGTGEMESVIRNLAGLEDDDLRDALDQMSGQVNVTNLRMVAMDSEAITDLIRSEMSRDAEDDLGIRSGGGRSGFWVEVVGAHGKFSETDGLSGADVNLGGLAGGYDVKSTDRYTFGGGLSFTGGNLSLNDLKEASQLSAPRGFGYAGVRVGPFRFHGGGSAAKTNTTSTREIHIQPADPSRDPNAAAFDRTTEAERQGTASDAWTEWQDTIKFLDWTTETKVGWRHVRFARDPFTEQGGGPIALQSGDTTITETESDVLVRSFKRSGFYRPYFMFTYRRSFGDESNSEDSQFVNQPNATFTVHGLPMPKNTVMGRTGLTINPGFGAQFTFEYEFRRAEFETRHTVDFRFRFR